MSNRTMPVTKLYLLMAGTAGGKKKSFITLIAWKVSKYEVFSGSYFPIFGLNTVKKRPEKTPYLDTFHAVLQTWWFKWRAVIFSGTFDNL